MCERLVFVLPVQVGFYHSYTALKGVRMCKVSWGLVLWGQGVQSPDFHELDLEAQPMAMPLLALLQSSKGSRCGAVGVLQKHLLSCNMELSELGSAVMKGRQCLLCLAGRSSSLCN